MILIYHIRRRNYFLLCMLLLTVTLCLAQCTKCWSMGWATASPAGPSSIPWRRRSSTTTFCTHSSSREPVGQVVYWIFSFKSGLWSALISLWIRIQLKHQGSIYYIESIPDSPPPTFSGIILMFLSLRSFGTKDLLVPKIFWYQRSFGSKDLLVPKIWYQRSSGTKDLLVPKIMHSVYLPHYLVTF